MIKSVQSLTDALSSYEKRSVSSINIENCSPRELENYISGMYKNGEISLKETLIFRPLDISPLAADLGIDSSKISVKYFPKVHESIDVKRNLYSDYKSILNQMVIDRDSSQNIALMKDAVALLDKIKQSSFRNYLTGSFQDL